MLIKTPRVGNKQPSFCELHRSPQLSLKTLNRKPLMGLKRGGTLAACLSRENPERLLHSMLQKDGVVLDRWQIQRQTQTHTSPLSSTPPDVLQWGLAEYECPLTCPISESAPDHCAQSQPSTCWRAGLPHTGLEASREAAGYRKARPKAGSTGCAAPPKGPHRHLQSDLPQAAGRINHHHPP